MQEITAKVIQTFTPEERILFRAGFLDENRNWTKMAKMMSIEIFLNNNKKDMVSLAQTIINEERDYTFGNVFNKLLQRAETSKMVEGEIIE